MVKNSIILVTHLLIIGLCTLFTFSSKVSANNFDYGIEVKGQASILVEPDRFSLSVSVIEKGQLTDKVRARVDHKSNQIIETAKKLGIEAHNINSARVSLRVIKDDSNIAPHSLDMSQRQSERSKSKIFVGVPSSEQVTNVKPVFFELSRNITVNFSEIKDYDLFLNAVIKIGVSQISPLSMSISESDKFYQQAIAQAVNNAKEKAKQIAIQSEQKLGKLVYVKEMSSHYYQSRNNSAMMSVRASYEHNSQVGNQAISASVLVKYAIE